MGVQYTQFNEVNMNDIDAVVVGSGFAGGVVARELAERAGKRCYRAAGVASSWRAAAASPSAGKF